MTATIPTDRVDFDSGGTRCAAWLTLPAGRGPHPPWCWCTVWARRTT